MAWGLTSVTDSLHLVRGELVNWTVATGEDGVTLFDAGLPGDRDDVLASLSELGAGADDVRAIVLTHAHVDHLGSAIWFATVRRALTSSTRPTRSTSTPPTERP